MIKISEEEFIDKCIEAVKQLIPEIEKLEDIGLEKLECLEKVFELCFWLQQYKIEKEKKDE